MIMSHSAGKSSDFMMYSILCVCVGLFGGQIALGRNQLHMIMCSVYYIAAIECGFGFFWCMHACREVCVCVCVGKWSK